MYKKTSKGQKIMNFCINPKSLNSYTLKMERFLIYLNQTRKKYKPFQLKIKNYAKNETYFRSRFSSIIFASRWPRNKTRFPPTPCMLPKNRHFVTSISMQWAQSRVKSGLKKSSSSRAELSKTELEPSRAFGPEGQRLNEKTRLAWKRQILTWIERGKALLSNKKNILKIHPVV